MPIWHFIEITNTLISKDCVGLLQMLIDQNNSQMFAYLSVECPPKLVHPRIRIQVQMEKKISKIKGKLYSHKLFSELIQGRQKMKAIKN